MYASTIGARRYAFPDLKTLLARATPLRSGDALAGIAAESDEERVAAQYALADLPLASTSRSARPRAPPRWRGSNPGRGP
jgi:ethanolamine ammonia-lyase large subunit